MTIHDFAGGLEEYPGQIEYQRVARRKLWAAVMAALDRARLARLQSIVRGDK